MRTVVALCVAALLATACASTTAGGNTCEEAEGSCVAATDQAVCGESMPYQCDSTSQVCCRLKAKPASTATTTK